MTVEYNKGRVKDFVRNDKKLIKKKTKTSL